VPYLNVAEVESALIQAASVPNASFSELITLPNKTWEGRTSHALKLANGKSANRPAVFMLGGIHAREWGSCDILINFIEQIQQAYLAKRGITLGGKTFAAADIQKIINTLDVLVFPQANPDGRNHSMTADAMWRKNRRPAPAGKTDPACVGVDLNRNYDFLWNYTKFFSPKAPVANSKNPCDYQVYIGPAAFSEPETRNVKWLFDQHANIRFFVDLHSFGEDVMYTWGDATNQATRATENFRNSAFNGKRGLSGAGAYKEFLPSADQGVSVNLATRMHDAIRAVRNKNYVVKQDFDLYPTAGASDDYATARHWVDGSNKKIYSFTLEWGTEFQPAYAEMANIIQDITAAMIEFCLGAIATPAVVTRASVKEAARVPV
jgi:murein tripeptide amidase MpaA